MDVQNSGDAAGAGGEVSGEAFGMDSVCIKSIQVISSLFPEKRHEKTVICDGDIFHEERSFEEVSKHKFGCPGLVLHSSPAALSRSPSGRLMERLIEHLEPSQTAVIAEEIIPKAA